MLIKTTLYVKVVPSIHKSFFLQVVVVFVFDVVIIAVGVSIKCYAYNTCIKVITMAKTIKTIKIEKRKMFVCVPEVYDIMLTA